VQHALSNTASTTDAIFLLLEHLYVELSQHLSTVIWSIWKHRNLIIGDDVIETSAVVVERARNMVADWQLANAPDVLASTSTHQPTTTLGMGSPPRISLIESHGSLLCQEDTNVILTRLFLLTLIVHVFVFVFVTHKVLLSWLRLLHTLN